MLAKCYFSFVNYICTLNRVIQNNLVFSGETEPTLFRSNKPLEYKLSCFLIIIEMLFYFMLPWYFVFGFVNVIFLFRFLGYCCAKGKYGTLYISEAPLSVRFSVCPSVVHRPVLHEPLQLEVTVDVITKQMESAFRLRRGSVINLTGDDFLFVLFVRPLEHRQSESDLTAF